MKSYVQEFFDQLVEEIPEEQLSILNNLRKSVVSRMEERIIKDREHLMKLEATVSNLQDK